MDSGMEGVMQWLDLAWSLTRRFACALSRLPTGGGEALSSIRLRMAYGGQGRGRIIRRLTE
jgi:hypothetical protein